MTIAKQRPIAPRIGLDFSPATKVRRYWYDGDAFKTRLFDADSLITPPAERFFINAIRRYIDRIDDETLREQAVAFIQQEGQHSRQHIRVNDRLEAQGVDVAAITKECDRTDRFLQKVLPDWLVISMTAACEYLTAVTAKAILENPHEFAGADKGMFALIAWHAAEEFEHKSVCFDVMQKVAKVGYFRRALGMLVGLPLFAVRLALTINRLLKVDGLGRAARISTLARGFVGMHTKGGLTRLEHADLVAYFRPGFHPSELDGHDEGYRRWQASFLATGDAGVAAAAVIADRSGAAA